ncbi:MAG: molybdopterin-guanine dinucleotide biosynthesis protein MobB [Thaumarchaeota archaeon]|nr:molybdopterin-guanine dinucleotide biosynthesis protein MobB [Nitrososphaerota archaeon]
MHASAGASVVVAFAPKEIDIIRKERSTSKVDVKEILGVFEKAGVDYLLVEGVHKKFRVIGKARRIICARSEQEAENLITIHSDELLFVTGKFAKKSKKREIDNLPILSLPRDGARALDLIGKV